MESRKAAAAKSNRSFLAARAHLDIERMRRRGSPGSDEARVGTVMFMRLIDEHASLIQPTIS